MPSGSHVEEDTRSAYEGEVALGVAWLVAMVRAFRAQGRREEPLTGELGAAQSDLMQAIFQACDAGLTLEELQSRVIGPALTRPGVPGRAAALLRETVQRVQNSLRPA
jgi:hypothetical protein